MEWNRRRSILYVRWMEINGTQYAHNSMRREADSSTKRFVYFLLLFIRNDPDVRIEAIGLELIDERFYAVPQTRHHDDGNEYTHSDF